MRSSWTENQERYFEGRIGAYRELYGRETPFHRAMIERLIDFGGIVPGSRVLELGCGVGRLTLPLLRMGCRVTAVDISAAALRHLEKKAREEKLAENLVTMLARGEDVSLEQPADAVMARGLLHHLESLAPFLGRMFQLLASGGRAVFMDPNPLQPAWLPFVLVHPSLSLLPERRLWRGVPRLVRSVMRQAGFRQVDSFFLGLVPPPLWSFASLARSLEDRLAASPLRYLALYHAVKGLR